jgi:hypothetical protein
MPIFRQEMKTVIDTVTVPAIKQRIPVKSGNARNSVRAVAGGNVYYIKAGNARTPYYGWLDFGGRLTGRGRGRNQIISRPIVKGGRYIYPGLASTADQLVEAAGRALDQIIQKAT